MLKKIIDTYKNFDKITHKVLKHGLEFCFALCIVSILVLLTYNFITHSSFIYTVGISLFKLSLVFSAEFVICSFVTDGIKKQLI